jgi:AraC-like DNA-binding protein/mannose-6-phosphate isomerase-like protein (cupin superfamily)
MVNRHLSVPVQASNGFCAMTPAASQIGQLTGQQPTKRSLHWERHYSTVERQISADGVHFWPFRPGFPLDSLAFTCSAPNVRMNRHDYCEIMYVHSGSAQFQVQDRSYPLNRGDAVVVGPSLYHRVFLEPASKANLALIFFQPELLNDPSTAESAEYLMPFFQQPPDFPVVIRASSGVPAQIFGFMEKIRSEMPAETSLEPLFAFLEANFSRHVAVAEAARRCAMSSSHFMFFFKRVTGQSFIGYANHFRIAKAQELLRTSEKSISVISQETGFCDQSHFGATFRRMVGSTPRAYRRQFSRAPSSVEAAKSIPPGNVAAQVH